jgi:transcriptional regulator with XRE-family HTH domain
MTSIMTPERFGKRLKALRERRGLTQEALAAKAGVARAYVARLEIGRHDPSLSRLQVLARALGMKVSKLVE